MFYRILRAIFALIARCYFSLKVEGLANIPGDGPVIVCTNHVSWWDPVLVCISLKRPVHFMAKKELFAYPVFGYLLRKLNAFPVNRGKADIGAIREGLAVLGRGEVLGIFPEGTRQRGGKQLGPMHPGAALLALKTGAVVVPGAIRGSYSFRGSLTLAFGKPIVLKPVSGQLSVDIEEGSREIAHAIETVWEALGSREVA